MSFFTKIGNLFRGNPSQRTQRIQLRQDARTARVTARVTAHAASNIVAYENGIDPKAALAGSIEGMMQTAFGTIGNILNPGSVIFGSEPDSETQDPSLIRRMAGMGSDQDGTGTNVLVFVVIGIVLVIILSSRRHG